MKQLDRIDRFLKSLENDGIITAEKQSAVFSPDFGMLGGSNTTLEPGGCTNKTAGCNGTNVICTNYDDKCDSTAKNEKCENLNSSITVCKPNGTNDPSKCGVIIIVQNKSTQNCQG